jgi:hypothetical protein
VKSGDITKSEKQGTDSYASRKKGKAKGSGAEMEVNQQFRGNIVQHYEKESK